MISLRTDAATARALSTLEGVTRESNARVRKLATGDRLTFAAEDAAATSVASALGARHLSLRMARANAEHGISMISVAEGGMREIGQTLIRMRELAVAAASETLTGTERSYLDHEFAERSDEITRTALAAEWGGIRLLDSAGQAYDVQVGIDGTADSRITIRLEDLQATTLGVDPASTHLLDVTAAQTAIGDVDAAIDTVNGFRSDIGATHNRILSAYRLADGMRIDTAEAEGRIRDADVMLETAELVRNRLTLQTALSFVIQTRQLSRDTARLLLL
ncbi:MAG: flagellin [Myxococcota bacterium]